MSEFVQYTDKQLYLTMVEVRDKFQEMGKSLEELKVSPLGQEVRRRAKADLFFLIKYFIGFDNKENELITEESHRRVCNLFIQKDGNKDIGSQDWRKERLLLYPRSGLKSWCDVADAVQWILNFPNIRVLFLTATDELAKGFVSQLKAAFFIQEVPPSFMNMYFPEFCIKMNKKESEFEFTCPMRTIIQLNTTVTASSLGATKAGFRFDIIKADDPVSDINAENEDQCNKVKRRIDLARKLLMPYGYLDMVGTRYHDADAWGQIIEKNVGDIKKSSDHPNCQLIENMTTGLIILIGKAIVVKAENIGKTYMEAGEEGCTLLYPKFMPFSYLMNEFNKNEEIFEGQLNQNPRPKSSIIFDRPLMLKHTVNFTQLPLNGPVVITWDFAFSKKKGRDYSTAAVGIYDDKGRLFIIDLIRKRFNHTELAEAIVDLALKWKPIIIGIEDAAGSKNLEPAIWNQAQRTGNQEIIAVCSKIDWITPENQFEAKKSRMAALHPLLTQDMLFFVSHLPYLEVLYDEFEVCQGSGSHHNDIPDVISRQPRYAPRIQVMIQKNEISTLTRDQAQFNLLFEEDTDAFGNIGRGYTPSLIPEAAPADIPSDSSFPELPNVLGSGLFG